MTARRLIVLAAVLACALPAASHLRQFVRVGGVPHPIRWNMAAEVRWNLNPERPDSITGSRSLADVMAASFQTWNNAPNASVTVARGPDSDQRQRGFDGINLVCFVCPEEFAEGSGTLALTVTTIATEVGQSNGRGGRSTFVGEILDSDILFNPDRAFSTTESDPQDLETVATHEVGHFLGLDHSGVVRAVMFPFAPPRLRTLADDDVGGLASLYPKPAPDVATGAIAGRISHASGGGVFGAHVFAVSTTGTGGYGGGIRRSPLGTLTAPDGSYRIEGVPPGSYLVLVEPLDRPVSNENVDGYPPAHGRSSVQTNFTTRWH